MPVKCCETLYTISAAFSSFKCPSMLAVDLVYIEVTVQDRVVLSYSIQYYTNMILIQGLEVDPPDEKRFSIKI